MKFLSMSLTNYIGIYNGLGLYEIHIDMTLCKNRIIIIRGDNGSGKSTIMKALSLFPDGTDSFIPGLSAKKEIVLQDGNTIYKLTFVHNVRNNGDRETTKAYITKTFGDAVVELNENGNVSSFKDILYTELSLDANFMALSQLSNDDRGLADKRPAERKKFVNSIISSLDTYNGIYKTLTKRSSNFKSLINAVVAKLNILGDESALRADLESLESQINRIQDDRDKLVIEVAKLESKISMMDPDGSIQLVNANLTSEIGLLEKELYKVQSVIDALVASRNVPSGDFEKARKRVIDLKNTAIIQNQIDRNTIEAYMRQRESESASLNEKTQRLKTLEDGKNIDQIRKNREYHMDMKESIEYRFSHAGISDPSSISKDEYILALNIVKDLRDLIAEFKAHTDSILIERLCTYYIANGRIIDRPNILDIKRRIAESEEELRDKNQSIVVLQSKMGLLDKLNLRPSGCKDDSCPFIKDALDFASTDPKHLESILEDEINRLRVYIDNLKMELEKSEELVSAIDYFSSIIKELNKNFHLLKKVDPTHYSTPMALLNQIYGSWQNLSYMDDLLNMIDIANDFDIYKTSIEMIAQYDKDLAVYESRAQAVDSILKDIEKINSALADIMDKIDPITRRTNERDNDIVSLEELESFYTSLIAQDEKKKPIIENLNAAKRKLEENNIKMASIQQCLDRISELKINIANCSAALTPLMRSRDKAVHSLQMMEDYKVEKAQLQENYDFIERIKFYSSPTTGIQLVFMELYMGKVISLANELLSLLFQGQYVIQPFVINESEFRIPCLGSGYMNDDISSMSSSQIGMISMILSFALLHHSSTKYNIIKLDEIDGPLDYSNRVFFMDVLNSIMNIMGTEQCIMISHNSELQVDNSDVILLRHDPNNTDYRRGNIIWSC